MSRIGKKPIEIPKGVTAQVSGARLEVKGSRGTLVHEVEKPVTVRVADGKVIVERPDDARRNRALHGLTRSLIANMIEGVTRGFEKKLLITGVGYRASLQGNRLNLSLGFSHPVTVDPPAGISFEVGKAQTDITVRGIDKQLVGQVAANVRQLRKTEPYKGKGIRYEDERVRRKAGKSVSAGK